METIQQFLKDNPVVYGIFLILLGLFLLSGAIFDWNWLFGNVSPTNYNANKIDGLVNLFGRKTARVVFGALCLFVILGGILMVWLNWRLW